MGLKARFILAALPGHAVEGIVMTQISVCSVVRSRYILNTMKNQNATDCFPSNKLAIPQNS